MSQWGLTAVEKDENPLFLVGLSLQPMAGPLSWASWALLEGHAEVWAPQAPGTRPTCPSQLPSGLFGRTCQSLAGFPPLMKGERTSESFTR